MGEGREGRRDRSMEREEWGRGRGREREESMVRMKEGGRGE